MFRASAVLLACALSLSSPARAQACKCAPESPVGDALRSAAAVFEGRVSKLTPLGSTDLVVELSVVRSWKDADTEHILLRTRQDEAACGFPFVPDQSYLIYADADEAPNDASLPGLEVLRCGRTKLITDADADLAVLGMGSVPVAAREGDLPSEGEVGAAHPDTATNPIMAQEGKPAAGGCASCSALGQRTAPPLAWLSGGGFVMLGLARVRRQRHRRTSARQRRVTP
jgi:hypothetical protein